MMGIITLEHIYILTGIFLLIFGVFSLLDKKQTRKVGTGLFWIIYGVTFCFGKYLRDDIVGWLVIIMTLIVVGKQMGLGFYNESSVEAKIAAAKKLGNSLFIPALGIGVITFAIAALPKTSALVGFGIASIVTLIGALVLTKGSPVQSFQEGRRLLDAIGWAAILSQLLAALGFLFDKAGVGKVVSSMVAGVVPQDNVFIIVVAYCVGMAIFTIIMGNAFAAFAVITSGIGLPMLVKLHGANPAVVGTIAMLAGYCGTLLTPMAANFNIVPAALLEMKSKYGVIRAQWPIAIATLIINILLMYFLGL